MEGSVEGRDRRPGGEEDREKPRLPHWTLNSATEATSPHPEEYWYNLKTGQVERGQQSAVTSLWGPFKTYEEAAHAMDRARERNDAWDKDSNWS